MKSRKAFRNWTFLCNLALTLSALCLGTGCSKAFLGEKADAEKKWICDNDADEAMKRNDYDAGISLHERFLEKEPENALALYHLGYAYGQTGDHLKEVSYYERAISHGFKNDFIFYNLGMAYAELNELDKSVGAYKKALEMDPESADIHFGLAMAYYQMGIADKQAEEEFLNAIKIDPEHVDARLYLSLLYRELGEIQKAAEQLHKVLEIDPNNSGAQKFLKKIEQE
jgi:tetratricopeptide (TPR) repeat protein